MTIKAKVLEALQSGNQLTAKQIASRFGSGNPREVVRSLRADGFAIFANPKTNSKGETKTFYLLGTPTRAMVAAAYASVGA